MSATTVSSVAFAPKHQSGIDVIDSAWGGLYRGGSYLVYGKAASGRGLLTLMFARTGATLREPTLFISADRQKDLMIQAASIGFDLRGAYESGVVRLMRVPPLMNIRQMGDDGVSRALWDLIGLIRQHRPTRLVMNDFMPFVAFRSFDRFRVEFIQFLEQIDSLETTLMVVMPEPANQQSRRVIDFMSMQTTGSIHIELADDNPTTTKRRVTLIPHIGHIKRQVVDYWDLEDVVEEAARSTESQTSPGATEPTFTTVPGPEAGYSDSSSAAQRPAGYSAPTAYSEPVAAPSVDTPPPGYEQQPYAAPVSPSTEAPPAGYSPPQPGPTQTPVSTTARGGTDTRDSSTTIRPEERRFEATDRETFRLRLQQKFLMRESGIEPFLLLAMRMDRKNSSIRPFDFDFLMDLVRTALRPHDDMLADTSQERLIVFLADSRPEEAQSFFARLKERLRTESPQQADHLLHSVSAIVVPDGRPFQSADEFLGYALDQS
jgi:KaiC/GvpD/RAD55 family RecA-like ATPase